MNRIVSSLALFLPLSAIVAEAADPIALVDPWTAPGMKTDGRHRYTVRPPEATAVREAEFFLRLDGGAGELYLRLPVAE